jgi:hypothetical protein
VKTSELTGCALDWAVARCEGVYFENLREFEDYALNYCTDWEHGGPIIERETIDVFRNYNEGCWQAEANRHGGCPMGRGPTPLIAAMRCFVASKLGDEVEIPKELACEQ